MSWSNVNDRILADIVNDIKNEMNAALDQIEECKSSPTSEYNTDYLEKGIHRFIEDYCREEQ